MCAFFYLLALLCSTITLGTGFVHNTAHGAHRCLCALDGHTLLMSVLKGDYRLVHKSSVFSHPGESSSCFRKWSVKHRNSRPLILRPSHQCLHALSELLFMTLFQYFSLHPSHSSFSLSLSLFLRAAPLFRPHWEMTGISHLAERVICTFSSLLVRSLLLSPSSLTLCTGFFGIPLVCVSQGKAAPSWDSLNYLCLSLFSSLTQTHLHCFSSSLCLRGSFLSMQDTLLQSVVRMGPNLHASANELSALWAAFSPAGCAVVGTG